MMKWISSTDRLPEITDPADGDFAGGFSDWLLVWPTPEFGPPIDVGVYSELRMRFETREGEPFPCEVTHWRPLPCGPNTA